jgi:nicotinate-nucleotide adenylyltransferase
VTAGGLGILGGTFNPPHIAHLLCAGEACEQLGLDRVLLMPVAMPPHKEAEGDPGPQVRLELCRAAVAADDRLGVSDLEIVRGGHSYTVDTLEALHAERPGQPLTFIVGADMAMSLERWRSPERVLELATLAVAEREGARREQILAALSRLPAATGRLVFFDLPRIDLSSSLIRGRVAAGRSIRYMVPDPVLDQIAQRGLYADLTNPAARPTTLGTQAIQETTRP